MPLLTKRRVVAAKAETTAGVPVALENADAIYATDVKVTPDIMFTQRPDDATTGQRTGVVGAKKGKIIFKVEFKGSGSNGSAPHWATVLLPACGFAATSNVYTPTSVTANYKNLTIGAFEDGLFKSICGAMGNFKIEAENGKPIMLNFEFEGAWVTPTDIAMLTPESDTVKPSPFLGTTFTLGTGIAPISKFSVDAGNKITLLVSDTQPSGYSAATITDRDITGKVDPEASLVATRNVFGEFTGGSEQSMTLVVTGGTLTAPKVQFKAVTEGDRSGIVTHELDFQCNRNAGDDEFAITF